LVIASLLGDIKQAALDGARTSIRVADERSNNRGRDDALVGAASCMLNEKRDAAGRCKLLGGKLGCGNCLESTRCIADGTTGRSSGGEGGGVDGGDGGVGKSLSLAFVAAKAGSLSMTSCSIRRCRGWMREASGGERSGPLSNNHSFSGKHIVLAALE